MAGAARPAARRWGPLERDLRATHGPLLAGVDEVGRGPLAGPVVACAVVMPADARAIRGIDDSKRLTPAERVRLAVRIRERALSIGVGAASVTEIDRLNIYHATVVAMRRALARLGCVPDHVLVDGKAIRTLGRDHTAVVGGDARCYTVACASIIAKVTRDRLMHALARRHPAYAWERNVGYGTPTHRAGLDVAGLTPHHRRSFCHPAALELDLGPRDLEAARAEATDVAMEAAIRSSIEPVRDGGNGGFTDDTDGRDTDVTDDLVAHDTLDDADDLGEAR